MEDAGVQTEARQREAIFCVCDSGLFSLKVRLENLFIARPKKSVCDGVISNELELNSMDVICFQILK